MRRTLMRIAALKLWRDRAALAMAFALPIAFFSVFALIFGRMGGSDGVAKITVVVADEAQTAASRKFAAAIASEPSFAGPDDRPPPLLDNRTLVREAVEQGQVDVGIVLGASFDANLTFAPADSGSVTLYTDTIANPIAQPMASGLLQKLAMTALPNFFIASGIEAFSQYAGTLTDSQRTFADRLKGDLETDAPAVGTGLSAGLVRVEVEDVRQGTDQRQRRQRLVAFQAAGIGVMFLLFSMAQAAQSLLEEEETGTLERLLNTGLGMGTLLQSYWLFAAFTGFAQVTLMFLWGWALFGLDLFTPTHFAGFVIMTGVTALAAAAFGLVLGTFCRSRAQLGSISTIVILLMSALGGSMIPRFLLRQSPLMDKLGLLTFNAWAIDGYQKVFWYERGLLSLWPQVVVLLAITAACLVLARGAARRWEVS